MATKLKKRVQRKSVTNSRECDMDEDDVKFVDKADELPIRFDGEEDDPDKDGLNNEFWLKKQTAEVYSDQREIKLRVYLFGYFVFVLIFLVFRILTLGQTVAQECEMNFSNYLDRGEL